MDNSNIEIGKIYTRRFLDNIAKSKGNLMIYKKKDINSLSGNLEIEYKILDIISNCQVYDYNKEFIDKYHFDMYNNIIIAKELLK